MPSTQELTSAAVRLHSYLVERHWSSPVVMGPDPGVRWNSRLGRFVKSYAPFVPWNDDMVYSQAQKYWIQSNLLIDELDLSPEADPVGIATETGCYLRDAQTPEGYWTYPNPEWANRIATVEGNYAAIGLLLVHNVTGDASLLEGATRWYDYTASDIGFQERDGTLAVNYFGNVAGPRVPNNSASSVRVNAMIAKATGDDRYLEYCRPMVDFMAAVQDPSGELPYSVEGASGEGRHHFLCFQYNAFQFLNILDYWRLTGDERAEGILHGLVHFLDDGLTSDGAARYDCSHDSPEVVYYGAAVASALGEASTAGFGDYEDDVSVALDRLLGHQKADGGFPYSFQNYRFARDTRSYPRYLSMILTHLLTEIKRQGAGGSSDDH